MNRYVTETRAAPPARRPLLLSVEEAATLLGIARRRVFELIGDGQIPSVKIGRSRRIRMADLEEWVKNLPAEDPATASPA